jgi:hypothetical protein
MASSLFLSSDVGLQVKLLVQQLHGSVPAMLAADPPLTYSAWLAETCGVAPNDLSVTAQLVVRAARARVPTCGPPLTPGYRAGARPRPWAAGAHLLCGRL